MDQLFSAEELQIYDKTCTQTRNKR